MLKFIISIIVYLILSVSIGYSQTESVYICKVDAQNDVLLEDHVTRERNQDKSSDPYIYYEKYTQSISDMLISFGIYSDKNSVYYFDKEYNEFEKYTDIKIGDIYSLSTPVRVYQSKVIGYKVLLDDAIGAGNIFYVVLENPEPSRTKEEGMCIAVKNSNLKVLDTIGVTDNKIISKFKNIVKKLIPDKTIKDNDFDPYESFKLFEGQFVNEIRMPQRPTKQYLVSYMKRTSFDSYSCLIIVYDEDGVQLNALTPVQIDSFEFISVIGILDVNNDGRDEILTEWGYYEGWGSELFMFDGENFIKIADGFFFGV